MHQPKPRTYHEFTARELDEFIDQHYGRNFDVYQNEGVTYNTVLVFDVSDRMTRFDQIDLSHFVGKQFVPNITRTLLTALCEKGQIPSGRYIITSAM